MAEVQVKLSRRYDIGSSSFDMLRFREPKLKDRRVVGPLFDVQQGVVLTNDEAIWAYAERLLLEIPTGAIGELDLTDTEAVEDTIRRFFITARLRYSERTSSSSGSDGTPAESRTWTSEPSSGGSSAPPTGPRATGLRVTPLPDDHRAGSMAAGDERGA